MYIWLFEAFSQLLDAVLIFFSIPFYFLCFIWIVSIAVSFLL